VQSIKQAKQFGILSRQKLVIPYYAPFTAKEVGAEIMEGVYCATDFWWSLEDKFPLAKAFVEAFNKKYGYKPEWGANAAYLQIAFWANAVETAGTFYPPEVIKAYEKGDKLQSTVGEVHFRAEDHQLVRPVVITRGKKKSAMKSDDDFFDVIEVVDGETVMQKPDEFGCKLGGYT
jgi:branched-chain amino acid transport system substrate-binding protein